ncbi:MAG: phosphate propanoyltransferase, partial [Candidatus Latescibacterota bacterium]
PNYRTELHLDTDDANAADLSCGDLVELIKL